MSRWETSRRRFRLPENWHAIRLQVLADADWVCQIRFEDRCLGTATEVDHIKPGDDHSRANLRAACWRCHAKKSSMEGHARKKELSQLRKRRTERHPGER